MRYTHPHTTASGCANAVTSEAWTGAADPASAGMSSVPPASCAGVPVKLQVANSPTERVTASRFTLPFAAAACTAAACAAVWVIVIPPAPAVAIPATCAPPESQTYSTTGGGAASGAATAAEPVTAAARQTAAAAMYRTVLRIVALPLVDGSSS